MTKIEKVEHEIERFDPAELAAFREWFRQYDAEQWDRQLEEDLRAGRLDSLAEEALAAHQAGKSKEL